jgi:outer membrane protein OmpA-like peptidoglycan-associated protein
MCLFQAAHSQHSKELSPGYYVVVSAYAPGRENVAQNYIELLNRRGVEAHYGFNSTRSFYFVYVDYLTDLKSSLKVMEATRKQDEFSRAWVRVIPGDIGAVSPTMETKPLVAVEEKKESILPKVKSEEAIANANPSQQPNKVDVVQTQAETQPALVITAQDPEISDNAEIIQHDVMTLGNTEVFLSLFNGRNNRIVEGTVKVVDTEKSKLLQEVKGNDYLYLPDPRNKTGELTLICEAFGYRKIQQQINYPVPLADTVKDYVDLMGTTLIINFDLVRYHKGDIGTLYHVYFYNDAALMLPESKYELNSLLQMMQENQAYKIRLHGHTNGNYHGRIILMGESKNFFSLDGSKNSVGSAKDLSLQRAETIKNYLVANGIAADRIELKSWGGKKPLYDKHGANAKRNVRVEVEILEE